MKRDVWDLDVKVEARYRVCFDRSVTLEEAIEMFNDGEYEDVIDEEEYSAEAVGSTA